MDTIEELKRMRELLNQIKSIDDILPALAPKVLVKKLYKDAKIPTKTNETDAGWDLYSTEEVIIRGGETVTIATGVAFEIPDDHVGLIWPRSGLAVKHGLDVLAGVIDAGYRGEIKVCLHNTSPYLPLFAHEGIGDVILPKDSRIAQIIFHRLPHLYMELVPELNVSDRADAGFGSSGLK